MIPFFKKKTGSFGDDQVTMITWITSDRLGRLVRLAESRSGEWVPVEICGQHMYASLSTDSSAPIPAAPISVAYFIHSNNDKRATRELLLLSKLYSTHPALSINVDIHLVSSSYALHSNTWRNVARVFSSTDYIMLWDADFDSCTDYQEGFEKFRRQHREDGWAEKVETGKGALVIPAFEWSDPVVERKRDLCPANKQVRRVLLGEKLFLRPNTHLS